MNQIDRLPLPESLSGYPGTAPLSTGRTVGDVISSVFPHGLEPGLEDRPELSRNAPSHWFKTPQTPADMFAVSAHLLELSGAFSYYSARTAPPRSSRPVRLWISEGNLKLAADMGRSWSKLNVAAIPPKDIRSSWKTLLRYWDWPINARAYVTTKTTVSWWELAYFLFVAADEASYMVGFPYFAGSTSEATFSNISVQRMTLLLETYRARSATPTPLVSGLSSSLCAIADPDVVCVQPKALVSNVGGGNRVFSHNLSYLRPRGIVRTNWGLPTDGSFVDEGDSGPINLLLVPLPKKLNSDNFRPFANGRGITGAEADRQRWRTFHVNQTWLKELDIERYITDLVKEAETTTGVINGVVLPELALNSANFEDLVSGLAKRTNVEFLVAGSSQDCLGKSGNFVRCARFNRGEADSHDGMVADAPDHFEFVQSKHHRWRLDKGQIKQYGLKLSNEFEWWEHINVGGRELNFVGLRSRSIFATLVCEDLARSEPCHELLRSIGPNLIFALLMDGPQITPRWSARYASSLAEDPGCAVLTLTSRGLAELSTKDGDECSIALFQDANGNKREIHCAPNDDGVVIELNPQPKDIVAIDGRKKYVTHWVMDDDAPVTPIKLPGVA